MNKDYILGRVYQRILQMYGDNGKPCKKTAEGKELFEQRSYANWAAWEYYYTLKKAGDLYLASNYFVQEMNTFSCYVHPNTRMFSVAYDVATDLNDFLFTI